MDVARITGFDSSESAKQLSVKDKESAKKLENQLKSSYSAKFVVNPIMYVDGKEADESSDDESLAESSKYNELSDKTEFDKLVTSKKNLERFPYRPFFIVANKPEKNYSDDMKLYSWSLDEHDVDELSTNAQNIAKEFIKKLNDEGLEKDDDCKIEKILSVSMLLNRPLSISTRRNNLLQNKHENLTENTTFGINCRTPGIFWISRWYNKNNDRVKYEKVRIFYKKLKKYDKIEKTSKAEQFKNISEEVVPVPYRKLREYAKKHKNTYELIGQFRGSHVYLSIVDGDTFSFNGIYSAYRRIHENEAQPPRVMSTGYIFPKDEKYREVLKIATILDRAIRIITNKYIPGGVYFPEPNTCILIPPEKNPLPETFVDKTRQNQKQDKELACLLKDIRRNDPKATFIFSDANPLMTSIPTRAKQTKNRQKQLEFSDEFVQGGPPSEKDVETLKVVSQSHYDECIWSSSLFINDAIQIKRRNTLWDCIKLLSRMRKGDVNIKAEMLKDYLLNDDVIPKIIKAIEEIDKRVNQYLKKLKSNAYRPFSEYRMGVLHSLTAQFAILSHTSEYNLSDVSERTAAPVDNISNIAKKFNLKEDDKKRLSIFAKGVSEEVLDELATKAGGLKSLLQLDDNVLECFFDDEDIIENVFNEKIELYSFLDFLNDNFAEYVSARTEYRALTILQLYQENTNHLTFMAINPTDVVYVNYDDEDTVIFGMEHYRKDVDLQKIRSKLGENTPERREFDLIISKYESDLARELG